MTETFFCPATANQNGTITYSGDLHRMIGEATVTSSSTNGTSGTFAFNVINNDGPMVKWNSSFVFTSKANTGIGAYLISETTSGMTFTITPKGQSAMTYKAFGLANSAGVLQDLFGLRIDSTDSTIGEGCSDEMILRSN